MKFAFAPVLVLLTIRAAAQVYSASLSGEVLDPSGAAVPGVEVVIREQSTGFTHRVVTNSSGVYVAGELAPGRYTVSVARRGFAPLRLPDIDVAVNQQARLDLVLKTGAAAESIDVVSQVSPVQKEDSSIGSVLDSSMVAGLPLSQRTVTSLITLGPGAIPRQLGGFTHDLDNDVQAGSRGSVALNPPINGARPYMNSELLDGAYNTDRNTFAVAVIPPLDSVQEFQVDSSLSPPAFAETGGGVVDVATKAGTEKFHGSAFEYLQNEATDAEPYFATPSLPRPVFRSNQFGGSLGGPIKPRATYFFVAYEGLLGENALPSVQLVPNAAVRGGNFAGEAIYDPLSYNAATGLKTPFPGGQIPGTRIDPIASRYLAQYEPLPNIPQNGTGNYIDNTPSTNDNNSVSARIDHQFSHAGVLFGRYTINNEDGGIGSQFPLRPTTEDVRAQQAMIGHTYSGTGWLNEARLSFTRLRVFDVPQSAFKQNVAAALGVQGAPNNPFTFGLPYFFVTNYSTVTDDPTLPQVQRDNTWDASESVALIRGHHSLRFGAEWIRFDFNYLQSQDVRGQYTYTGVFSALASNPNSGDAFADFLLGYPQNTQRTVGSAQAYLRENSFAGYLQDDWRVTPALTLNLGLRYEYTSPFSDASNQMLNVNYATFPQPPALVPVATAAAPVLTNFSPRVGLAYELPGAASRGGSAVFRAGYGIYFSPEIAAEAYDLVLNGIRTEINETAGTGLPILTTANGFPATSSTGFPSYFGLDNNAPTPYVQQWNAGLQKELPGAVLFEVDYVGSKGAHLGRFDRLNIPLTPGPGDLQQRRPFPSLGTIFQVKHIGNSSYNSLQVKAEKRMSRSLSFLASFVWSKSIDDTDSILAGQFDGAGAQNEQNLRLERGLSFFNVPRRLSAGFVYTLPASTHLRALSNGWQMSGTITVQDGTPLNPFYLATDFANTGTPNRPNIVLGQSISLPPSQRTPERWFNTNAFSAPAPYTYGNAGRDIIPGPGNAVVDLALHRRFALSEHVALELRAESFNLLNYPNWGIPGPYPDLGPFFGAILSAGDPRRLQFAARVEF